MGARKMAVIVLMVVSFAACRAQTATLPLRKVGGKPVLWIAQPSDRQ